MTSAALVVALCATLAGAQDDVMRVEWQLLRINEQALREEAGRAREEVGSLKAARRAALEAIAGSPLLNRSDRRRRAAAVRVEYDERIRAAKKAAADNGAALRERIGQERESLAAQYRESYARCDRRYWSLFPLGPLDWGMCPDAMQFDELRRSEFWR